MDRLLKRTKAFRGRFPEPPSSPRTTPSTSGQRQLILELSEEIVYILDSVPTSEWHRIAAVAVDAAIVAAAEVASATSAASSSADADGSGSQTPSP